MVQAKIARRKSRKVIWRCNSKFKGQSKCVTPHLDADTIQRMFLKAYNRLIADRESVISDCALMRQVLSHTTMLDAELDSLNAEITEITIVAELVKACVRETATTARVAELVTEKERKHHQDRAIRLRTEALKKQPLVLAESDKRLWIAIVDRATVFCDGRIVFKFKSLFFEEMRPSQKVKLFQVIESAGVGTALIRRYT